MEANFPTEIYLDANATTQVCPQAAQAASDVMKALYGNPSSTHTAGLRARNILETARELARSVLGAGAGQIVFTSGATEAIQMGVFSALCELRKKRDAGELVGGELPVLMYGATEHKAVPVAIQHWNELLGLNAEVLSIPVNDQGILDYDFLKQHVKRAGLVCTMAINNETGVITDLDRIEEIVRGENPDCAWLVDCVQGIGKFAFDLAKTTIDYATISGHKIFAPKGIGLLYVRESAPLVPLLAGGGQEDGARAGTENLPGVAAIAAVLEILNASPTRTFAPIEKLNGFREQILTALKQAFPAIKINAPLSQAVPTTINFAVQGFQSRELTDLFDAAGIRVSSGSACGAAAQSSYVLDAMGVEPWQSLGAIRMSFSPLASQAEIDAACQRIGQVGEVLHDSCLVITSDASSISQQKDLDGLIQLKSGPDCTWVWMDSKSRQCVIIDPFDELAERVETLVRCQQSKVVAVLDTHGHVDHDSCRRELLGALSEFQTDSADTDDVLGWPTRDGGECELGDGTKAPWISISEDLVLAKTDLPGHTVVSVAYLVGRLDEGRLLPENVCFAFTGDTILMDGVGRTDFPCSSMEKMYDSLRRIPGFVGPKTVICPTHDYNSEFATTLAAELEGNSFLNSLLDTNNPLSYEEYASIKPGLDEQIVGDSTCTLVCGLIKKEIEEDEGHVLMDLSSLTADPDLLVIDVREPHEFAFEQRWAELGFDTRPRNVPLTKLSGFLPEILHGDLKNQRIIFVCRSGRRSGLAAKIARRLGHEQAQHIAGGLALNTSLPMENLQSEVEYMI